MKVPFERSAEKTFTNPHTKSTFTSAGIESMLQELDLSKKLSDWEHHFVESISDQFERTSNLSEKQLVILERLYAEKT